MALTESVAILLHLGVQAIDQELAFRQGTADFDRLNRVLCFLNTDFYDSFSPLWYAFESGVEGQEKAALIDRSDYPNLNRLYEKLKQDTAVHFAHWIEEEERTTGGDAFRGHVSLEEALALMKSPR